MVFEIVEVVALVLLSALALLVLFEPGLSYRVAPPTLPLDSSDFVCLVAAVSDSEIHQADEIEVLTNGSSFYAAELAAVEMARVSVHVEMFILQPSRVADRFITALTEDPRDRTLSRAVVRSRDQFSPRRRTVMEVCALLGAAAGSREMSARRCCAASVLRAMRCQRAIMMRANSLADTRRCVGMSYSLKHRADYLTPIKWTNRAAVHLRVGAVLEAQKRSGLARFLPHDPDRSSTGRESARV